MSAKISRRSLFSALGLLPAARFLRGQQPTVAAPPPAAATPQGGQPTFSASVNLVNLFATVRDRQGKIVKGLTKDDFLLEEEGHPQTIKYFSQESDLPLTLGLLVDTSPSQRNVLSDERNASYRFFDQILREDRDLAFVIHFDYEVELLQDLTASRQLLEKSLDELKVGEPTLQRQGQGGGNSTGGYPAGGYPSGGYPSGYPGGGGQGGQGRARGGTDLYDAVLLAGNELMRKQKGRKALILLSDGVDTGSKTSLFDAIASAQKSDSLVYSILFADPNAYGNTYVPYGGRGMGRRGMGRMPMPMPGGGASGEPEYGKKVLQQIASETGGRFFQVSRTHPLDKIYAAIEEDLRNQYNIGYTPDPLGQPGSYRHIHLTAKKKNQVVQTREGYYLNPA